MTEETCSVCGEPRLTWDIFQPDFDMEEGWYHVQKVDEIDFWESDYAAAARHFEEVRWVEAFGDRRKLRCVARGPTTESAKARCAQYDRARKFLVKEPEVSTTISATQHGGRWILTFENGVTMIMPPEMVKIVEEG